MYSLQCLLNYLPHQQRLLWHSRPYLLVTFHPAEKKVYLAGMTSSHALLLEFQKLKTLKISNRVKINITMWINQLVGLQSVGHFVQSCHFADWVKSVKYQILSFLEFGSFLVFQHCKLNTSAFSHGFSLKGLVTIQWFKIILWKCRVFKVGDGREGGYRRKPFPRIIISSIHCNCCSLPKFGKHDKPEHNIF